MSANPKPRFFLSPNGAQIATIFSTDHIVLTHHDLYGECIFQREKDNIVYHFVGHVGRKTFVRKQTEMPDLTGWTQVDSPPF